MWCVTCESWWWCCTGWEMYAHWNRVCCLALQAKILYAKYSVPSGTLGWNTLDWNRVCCWALQAEWAGIRQLLGQVAVATRRRSSNIFKVIFFFIRPLTTIFLFLPMWIPPQQCNVWPSFASIKLNMYGRVLHPQFLGKLKQNNTLLYASTQH